MSSLRISIIIIFISLTLVESFILEDKFNNTTDKESLSDIIIKTSTKSPENIFNGVYTECFLHLSYSCLQEKTLLYLKELNKLSEVSVIGDYVKFVKVNQTDGTGSRDLDNNIIEATNADSEELSVLIDRAVDKFFNGHVLKFNAFGRDLAVPDSVEEFVGRKRKGGGGGGHGGGHGGGDGGKKKMMMMAMMCMKMKLMMMVPAMMGMMGMMSFKGMMFSMMSFMMAKMMLLMKILEKKGIGGGGGDGGWAAGGGGGGGAWMPAGGQDYGGGGGGGYDANGQWQSRAIADVTDNEPMREHEPTFTYIPPLVRANHRRGDKIYTNIKNAHQEVLKLNKKSRTKRGIMDVLQNAYLYWINRILGGKIQRTLPRYPNYKVINGVKYVYYPIRYVKKPKQIIQQDDVTQMTPIVTAEDFNKGEILEGPVHTIKRRSMGMKTLKKMQKMAKDVNDVIEDDPWE